jgi:hypothetical protein
MEPSVTTTNGVADVPEGTLIAGKYRIEGLIAHGGMGVLYRAWQPLIARNVAIKIVRPELMTRSDAPARFLREARVLAQLRTEHVCRVLDAGALDDGLPYMVLEYLEGDDLRNVLNESGRFDVSRAVDLVLQVAEALAEAHALGIVHRDVKPENLFLVRDASGAESIKLLDFGICQTESNAARARSAQGEEHGLGSPHYMAPEQISAPDLFDPRLDVWSLGIVLYELVSGDPPFDAEDVTAICAQVLGREAPSLRERRADIPRDLEHVVARCLAKQPSERYADMAELAAALAPYGSDAASASCTRVHRTLHAHAARTMPVVRSQDAVLAAPVGNDTVPATGAPKTAGDAERSQTGVVVSVTRTRRRKRAAKRVSAALVAGAVLVTAGSNVDQALAKDLMTRTLEGAPPVVRAAITAVGVHLDTVLDTAIRRYSEPPVEHDGDSSWSTGSTPLDALVANEPAHDPGASPTP